MPLHSCSFPWSLTATSPVVFFEQIRENQAALCHLHPEQVQTTSLPPPWSLNVFTWDHTHQQHVHMGPHSSSPDHLSS